MGGAVLIEGRQLYRGVTYEQDGCIAGRLHRDLQALMGIYLYILASQYRSRQRQLIQWEIPLSYRLSYYVQPLQERIWYNELRANRKSLSSKTRRQTSDVPLEQSHTVFSSPITAQRETQHRFKAKDHVKRQTALPHDTEHRDFSSSLHNSSFVEVTLLVAELATLLTLLAKSSTLLLAALTASVAPSPALSAKSARRALALSTAALSRLCALSIAPC